MPGPTKYARPEYERRFLLDRLPEDVSDPVRIRDRYVHDSDLRLRLVEDMEGNVLKRKLGQKQRADPADPRLVFHTTIYLDEREHAMLSACLATTWSRSGTATRASPVPSSTWSSTPLAESSCSRSRCPTL